MAFTCYVRNFVTRASSIASDRAGNATFPYIFSILIDATKRFSRCTLGFLVKSLSLYVVVTPGKIAKSKIPG